MSTHLDRTIGLAARVAALAVALVAGCSKSTDEATAGERKAGASTAGKSTAGTAEQATGEQAPATHWYRAVFGTEDQVEIPTFLELPAPGKSGTGRVVNGDQKLECDVTWTGTELTIAFPLYHARIVATAGADGELRGSWQVESKTLGSATLPFRAWRVESPEPATRFDDGSPGGAPIDLGEARTAWKARFSDTGTVKIELRQSSPGVFTASVTFPTGNHVYMAGNGRGNELRLSAVEGLSFSLLSAEIDPARKKMTGRWVSGTKLDWREELEATRSDDFEVRTALAPSDARRPLGMPQIARYAGKPLIVELGASWCPSCKHAAAALKKLYERHHAQGLEILTLSYEFTDDSAYNKRQAEAFKKTYGVPWEVIPVDGSADKAWELLPEGIDGLDVSGFPLTFFLYRDGTIHAVHASFAGPEEPEEHRRGIEEYERHAAAIMQSERGAKKP